jgi:hypothetical protein
MEDVSERVRRAARDELFKEVADASEVDERSGGDDG